MKAALRSAVAAVALLSGAAGARAADQSYELIERGRYVAVTADCTACHTRAGQKLHSGGVVLETPFGQIAAPNITPDQDTGMGRYSERDLFKVLREGIAPDGKHLYPAMPYPAYSKMTDEDIRALYAYLMTVEPVSNAVDVNRLPFPFNMRWLMAGWNLLNFDPAPFRPDPNKSAEWNRGAYLVEVLGHCGACHTPKSMFGADDDSRHLQGATLQGWHAPNITGDRQRGVGRWEREQIVAYLKTGSNHQGIASGPMSEEVINSSSRMSKDDLSAIAAYLQDTKAQAQPAVQPVAANDPQMTAGAAIYKDRCAACHGDNGAGAAHLFPMLARSGVVQAEDPATLIRVVLHGSRAGGTAARPTAPAMPAFDLWLDDAQVASVLSYIRNSWGNASNPVTASQVHNVRPSP